MNAIQSIICDLTASIFDSRIITVVYRDRDGVTSIRYVRVLSIEHCKTAAPIARVYDTQRNAPRSFRILSILGVYGGDATLSIARGAIQPDADSHEFGGLVRPYEPQTGDKVRLHYTGWPEGLWPEGCKPIEYSDPFIWSHAGCVDHMRSGWEFTVEKVED